MTPRSAGSKNTSVGGPTLARNPQSWAAVAFIVGLVLAAFWKLTVMTGVLITDDLFASDLMNENFPYRFSIGDALRAGQWPLWVREIYGGFPLLARSEAGVCYPLNIVLFGLFPPYVALNLTILVIVATAAVGMYFYAREIGASQIPSTLAGVALGFCGFFISHLKHLSMANAASWLPVGLLLLERAIKRNDRRSLLWFGVVFGLQHLAGNAQIAYYAGLLYALYFPLRLLHHLREATPDSNSQPNRAAFGAAVRGILRSRLAWSFIGMLILGTLLAAIQLLPTYELVSLGDRAGGVTFEYASKYAYDPKDFWTFFYPFSNGDIGTLTYTGKGVFWEDYGYVGVLTFFLAIYAAARCWRSWHVRFFAVCAGFSYLLVLGPATPLYKVIFSAVPGASYFRFPTRMLLVTDFSLVTLAAIGLTKLADRLAAGAAPPSRPWLPWLPWLPRRAGLASAIPAVLLALTVCDLLYFQLRQNPIVDMALWQKPPNTIDILRQDPTVFRLFCLGGNHAHRRMFAQAGGWEGSLQPFVEQREFIQPSSNVLYGVASPNGYANLTPRYLVDVWGDQNRPGIITQSASVEGGVFAPAALFWKLMRMYNVKYLTSFWPFAPSEKLHPLGVYGGAYFYRNGDYLPRSYLVSQVIPVEESNAALGVLRSEAFDPARSVLLPVVPPGFQRGDPDAVSGSVELLRYKTNEAEMKVQTRQSAILVFSDSYYPGWVADVDGRETTIYRANITQRAIVVPAGEHQVRFRFQPTPVAVGFWISLGAVASFLGFFLASFLSPWLRDRQKELVAGTARGLPG